VVGLVAITPAAAFVTVGNSIFIGFASSIVSNLAVRYKHKIGLDDTLDVFPCHGIGGIMGMLFTGIFAKDVGLMYGQTDTFLYHLLTLVLVAIFTFGGSYGLYFITDKIIPMRVVSEKEELGLDLSQHNEVAANMASRKY
jgi:ammonium transporter, Amt family